MINSFKTWLDENRLPAVTLLVFLIVGGALGWFVYGAWENYATALNERDAATSTLNQLLNQNPPPSDQNVITLSKAVDAERASLNALLSKLVTYRIPSFAKLDDAKPQDAPRLFQDALRAEVTKQRTAADASGVRYSPTFYLGLEEFENRLPQASEIDSLSRQLTVSSWIAQKIFSHRELVLLEFARQNLSPSPAKSTQQPSKKPNESSKQAAKPWSSLGTLKVTLECDQGSLREVLNAISQAPYFLIIDSLQLQNTAKSAPRRDSAGTNNLDAPAASDGNTDAIRRLHLVVGKERVYASFKITMIDFPATLTAVTPP